MLLLAGTSSQAAEARIDSIEILSRDVIIVHVYVPAGAEYVVQSINRLSCTPGTAGCSSRGIPTNWTTLFSTPRLPYPEHYAVPDDREAQRRFYRLRVIHP